MCHDVILHEEGKNPEKALNVSIEIVSFDCYHRISQVSSVSLAVETYNRSSENFNPKIPKFFKHPFDVSEIFRRGPRRPARSWPLAVALSRSKLPCSRPLLNFRRPRRHFERAFSVELARPGSILGRPDAPGLDFRCRNASIFERFRCARACCAYLV